MTKIEFLNKKQKKELKNLDKFEIPERAELIKIGKKIYAYTGSLNNAEILALSRASRIVSVGIYLFQIR